ncbi:MAG: DUF5320 domain-containing protein [Desulfosudaceae bacterium]
MPGFDGSGPQGMGPMTGGARGFCNPASASGAVGYGYGRGMAYRRGGGFGGFGPGRGLRRGFAGPASRPGWPGPYPYSPDNEIEVLKAQAASVKTTLEQINRRIAELEDESGE